MESVKKPKLDPAVRNKCIVKCDKCGEISLPIEKMSALICRQCRSILYHYHYYGQRWIKNDFGEVEK